MSITIVNGTIYQPDFHFHKGILTMKNEYITGIHNAPNVDTAYCKPSDTSLSHDVLDAAGGYVIPGLIDIHLHGCAGADFCDGTPEALQKITTYQVTHGITGICPASMTLSETDLLRITKNAADYFKYQHCLSSPLQFSYASLEEKLLQPSADLLGVRLEGPFLSHSKCGAQNPTFIQKASVSFFHRLQEQAQGLIRIVDVAPEADTDNFFIHEISKDCKISLAHTAADYTTCKSAFLAGASHVTHLFNAMTEFNHRKPGLVGAAYDTPACDVELICDGIHVDPAVIRMAFQLFTDTRIILISDSMRATGMCDGQYTLGGQTVKVSGSFATLEDGTLAGSVTNLMDCLRHTVSYGIPLESAIRCATANPAHSIGVAALYGYLKPGHIANIVILNPDLSLRHVILHGEKIL